MKIEIKHRSSGAVLFTAEVSDDDRNPIRTAVIAAVSSRANLAGANLAGANLAGRYHGNRSAGAIRALRW